ncbi:MAG: hypothetical protein LJE68_16995, partial [Rhodobacter sp.]|nr:hypothetical protein [Rhodobacter sp.]
MDFPDLFEIHTPRKHFRIKIDPTFSCRRIEGMLMTATASQALTDRPETRPAAACIAREKEKPVVPQ